MSIKEKILETELTEGLTTYRTQMTLVTQIVTVIMIGNVYVVGYIINSSNFHFLFIGAVFPLLIIFVRYVSFKLMVPILYVVYKFEKSLEDDKIDFLTETYMRSAETVYHYKFDEIIALPSKDERMKKLGKLSSSLMSLFSKGSRNVTMLCVLAVLAQILLAILL